MKTSVKIALASGVVAVTGALFLVGSSYADRGGFGPRFGMMGGPGGPMMREMLAEVDTNDDGALTQQEIDAAVEARLAAFDSNNSGGLSLEEFEAHWADITQPMAVRAFQFLDPNGDAEITEAELNDRFGTAVARLDRNDDGVLDRDDRKRGWRDGNRGRWFDRDDRRDRSDR